MRCDAASINILLRCVRFLLRGFTAPILCAWPAKARGWSQNNHGITITVENNDGGGGGVGKANHRKTPPASPSTPKAGETTQVIEGSTRGGSTRRAPCGDVAAE